MMASQPRASQFLPTVKCSNCNAPVPLAELGDHVCSVAPPVPSLPKPALNIAQATSLLPQRLQNLVTNMTGSYTQPEAPQLASPARSTPPDRQRFNSPSSPPDQYNNSYGRARSNSSAAASRPQPPSAADSNGGGPAGMAGVGRRGFAAAAQAALVTTQMSRSRDIESSTRRPYLDIDTRAAPTPPLSDGSGSSNHSPGPISPYPQSERTGVPVRSTSPSMNRQYGSRRNPSPSPTSGRDPYYSNRYDRDNKRIDRNDSSARYREAPSGRSKSQPRRQPPSPTPSSGSEYGGLAYDTDNDNQDFGIERAMSRSKNAVKSPLSSPNNSPPLRSARSGRSYEDETPPSPPRKTDYRSGDDRDRGRDRDRDRSKFNPPATAISQSPPTSFKRTDPSQTISAHRRGASGSSVMGLGSATMAGSKTQRSNTLSSPESPTIPLPRSRTQEREKETPHSEKSREPSRSDRGRVSPVERRPVKRSKICVRCEKKIEDGKWIAMENSTVLCERCWKNLYLPKCRRCNLPIEKQAVSSSDGQLKGKYHKECFNCHVCNEPFPDKTFYVFSGKPLCAYHYHEKNESLCSSASCGEPIEGACAVSHTGLRFHPDHMICEYQGRPRCKEKLDEYFEVDGLMLCEKHARMSGLLNGGRDDDDRWASNSKAMKRKTRFIDLASGANGAPPLPAYGGRR